MFLDQMLPNHEKRERDLNETIYSHVQACQDQRRTDQDRTHQWEQALKTVVKKDWVIGEVHRSIRPAHFNEPKVDKSLIDDRILEGFAPQLKAAVDTRYVNIQAAFAIVEYFTRTGYHNLTPDQTVALGKLFLPRDPRLPFPEYKRLAELRSASQLVPGKSTEESWVLKREVMDILEINSLIEDHQLGLAYGKTVPISELTKVSADALREVHTANTRLGVARLNFQDKQRRGAGQNRRAAYPDMSTGGLYRLLSRPDLVLDMVLSGKPRDFESDMKTGGLLSKDIEVVGTERIPSSGPVIIAFSHRDLWDDPQAPIAWEKYKMITEIQKQRQQRDMYVAQYLSIHSEVAPKGLHWLVKKVVPMVTRKAAELYGIHSLDLKGDSPDKMKDFLRQSQAVLQDGQALLISPEGLPALEPLKPKRGLGMLARTTGAPVVGVAFREDRLPNGKYHHKVIFTEPQTYNSQTSPGSNQERDQQFSDQVMRSIAQQLPESERGIYK